MGGPPSTSVTVTVSTLVWFSAALGLLLARDPVYDPDEYPDDYVKFLLSGLERVLPRERFRIYNKIGQAYGFTTENAWVVDPDSGRGFFLAATLYTNADGVLNDDVYEYETVAQPFLADLAEASVRRLWERSR